MPVVDLARRFADAGVAALLFTDVGRDGLLKGCNIEATIELARHTSIPVIASGGVAGLVDILDLARNHAEGIAGVIVGRALYDGRMTLASALKTARGG
jgi:phosphoribosylformimino-5-aminoimidazole carboxamide ribotide isomerase